MEIESKEIKSATEFEDFCQYLVSTSQKRKYFFFLVTLGAYIKFEAKIQDASENHESF